MIVFYVFIQMNVQINDNNQNNVGIKRRNEKRFSLDK